jgi:hypothetical protein
VAVPSKIAAACPAGMVAFGIGPDHSPRKDDTYINTKRGSRASTVQGRALTIRAKARAARASGDIATKKWLVAMTLIFGLAFQPVRPEERARTAELIMAAAAEVGELATAQSTILPMIFA